ncbi:MAG: hypothetical protein KDC98_02390 [Planctomycetes bacterium]|nr:hypothetical protein [Planctomycetota bacterium]
MNSHRSILLSALATTLLNGLLAAQTPLDPPPWWGVSDDRTLSLYWDFSGPAPFTPQIVGGTPNWYVANNTRAVITGPLQIIPSLAGHSDVLGLAAGAAPARLDLTVDNDPHLNWVKIFDFQFDVYEGTAGSIIESLAKDLLQYDRSSMTWDSVPIGNGWETVTVKAELWPQPDDEEINWSFLSDAVSDTGIDNLFVSSKCVKVGDADETGEGIGDVDTGFGTTGLDLLNATGADCQAVAVIENTATTQRTYWVTALATGPGLSHSIVRLDQAGSVTGTTPVPFTSATAPRGITDLAVMVRRPNPLAAYEPVGVYGLVYLAAGTIQLIGYDLNGLPLPSIPVTGLPALAGADYGLAYNPSGESGGGIFLLTDPTAGRAYEVSATTGAYLPRPTPITIPIGTTGAGYDHVFGNYYLWSQQPLSTSVGLVRTSGAEISAFDFEPTGTRFWGNLQVPNPGGAPGGVASGLEVYRRSNGDFRIACVARTTTGNRLYELKGPFKFGRSLHGVTHMDGLPFAGSNNFAITLDGLRPAALFAVLYVGFSNTSSSGLPLPFSLAGFGLEESQVLVSVNHMHSQLIGQQGSGQFRFLMPVMPQFFRGTSLYFQWLVFDPAVQNGLAMSSAGKTLIY